MGIFSREKKEQVPAATMRGPNFSVSFEAFLESYKEFRRNLEKDLEVLDAYVRERAEYQQWKQQNPGAAAEGNPRGGEWWRAGGWAKARAEEQGVNQ